MRAVVKCSKTGKDLYIEIQGPNKAIDASNLERLLGAEKIEWLVSQTGMSKEALLDGLSRELPAAVDQLTPDGRLPTEGEAVKRVEQSPTGPRL